MITCESLIENKDGLGSLEIVRISRSETIRININENDSDGNYIKMCEIELSLQDLIDAVASIAAVSK